MTLYRKCSAALTFEKFLFVSGTEHHEFHFTVQEGIDAVQVDTCQKRPIQEQKRPTDIGIPPTGKALQCGCRKRPSKEQKRPIDTGIPCRT